jgi:hypothetical protein
LLVSCSGGGGVAFTVTALKTAPISVAATSVNNTQINISWSTVSGATSYSVYRSVQSGTAYSVIARTTATLKSDISVTSGTIYYYVVSASNSVGEGPKSTEVSATPLVAGSSIVIQGSVTYEDKEYDTIVGQTGTTVFKAVRLADIELYNVNDNTAVASATTSTGYYQFTVSRSTFSGDQVYLRVGASAAPINTNSVNVMNSTGGLYYVKTANVMLAGNTNMNLAIPVSNAADGAFNILDVFTSGFQFVNALAGTSPPTLNAYWDLNIGNGTYFCPAGGFCGAEGIYVLNTSSDTDEFDDDVLWHEFGHFVMNKFSKDDSQGDTHYLNDNAQDLRLSWSEGWGNYFQTAIKYWLQSNYPEGLSSAAGVPMSQYTDTGGGGIRITIDIAHPETSGYCRADRCYYASNEISVARTLWYVMTDSAPNNLGMQPIWSVINTYMPTVPYTKLEDFWDGFLKTNGTGSLVNLQNIFSARSIFYTVDSYGSGDNSFASASTFTVNTSQVHTLYSDPTATSASDVDFVMFTVPSTTLYTISTSSLRNGIDTYLTLYSTVGGSVIAENDNASNINYVPCAGNVQIGCYDYYGLDMFGNPVYVFPPNNASTLSSRIQYILSPGTYYVSVTTSPSRPYSAGRYGSYTLMITTP